MTMPQQAGRCLVKKGRKEERGKRMLADDVKWSVTKRRMESRTEQERSSSRRRRRDRTRRRETRRGPGNRKGVLGRTGGPFTLAASHLTRLLVVAVWRSKQVQLPAARCDWGRCSLVHAFEVLWEVALQGRVCIKAWGTDQGPLMASPPAVIFSPLLSVLARTALPQRAWPHGCRILRVTGLTRTRYDGHNGATC
ncbi:hypothetical protein M440DRAFT_1161683 [Trichoderma longibrachiatum ATCC 18648]|uniref:Uncharacterized protein n=1 Tax=Trichoderma longibrachiatum ATCC 18648 TaxID=983965 RepID=A0A2T4CC79_TRILO|nr:hypothetical protein M440DRAFT_1161683 [Trichoderma longibrachiatum ATCC 18648]